MSIPNFQSMILPILELASDQDEHRRREVVDDFASRFSLTDEERELVTEKTGKNLFDNRCDFALSFLRAHRMIKKTRHGYFKIMERGLAVFKTWNQSPEEIENAFSKPQAHIIAYLNDEWPVNNEDDDGQSSEESIDNKDKNIQPSGESVDNVDSDNKITERSIEENYQQIRKDLAVELLQKIKDNRPVFFEELVIDLLVAMGYGGSREDAEAVGRSGDGGIDGVIKEDRLGLDVIYIQAKRWEGKVGTPPVRDFVGALQGKRARKGIFITTSNFSSGVQEYISAIDSRDSKVVLIDGNVLARLMIDHNVGVSTVETYEIKRVDSDYFAEDAE